MYLLKLNLKAVIKLHAAYILPFSPCTGAVDDVY